MLVFAYIAYTLYGAFILFIVIGAIHDRVYWAADSIFISRVFRYSGAVVTFYITIIFAIDLINNDNITLFYVSITSIILTFILNIISCFSIFKEWRLQNDFFKDNRGEWIHSNFIHKICFILFFSLCINAHYTLQLCNSYLFGAEIFSMGILPIYINQIPFQNNWNNAIVMRIIPYNIPQLILQCLLLSNNTYDYTPHIVILSMVLTIDQFIGSLMAFVRGISAAKLRKVLEMSNSKRTKPMYCSFTVDNVDEIESVENIKRLKISLFSVRDVISKVLCIHPRSIVMLYPMNDLKLKFVIHSSKLQIDETQNSLQKAIEHEIFSKRIHRNWKLSDKIESVQISALEITQDDDYY